MVVSRQSGSIVVVRDRDEIGSLIAVNRGLWNFEGRIVDILAECSAILDGHFELLGGQHSSKFLRFAKVAGRPAYMQEIAFQAAFLVKARALNPDAIVSRDRSGHLFGWEIGRQLGVKEIVVARTDAGRRPIALVNGSLLQAGAKVLIADDLITSGTGVTKLIELVNDRGGNVVGVAVFAIRENPAVICLPIPSEVHEVLRLQVGQYTWGSPGQTVGADVCQLCRQGIPLVRARDLA